ncbi:hypothetical protein SAMN05421766_102369 [Zobellia uliginosa]|uniref:Uncharacterized protein n=1 Tax=Zobellia uliginosa TaxID=143224 RepID=A0ABY1KM83_9FLAO|nr:hypothetical protein SAMN05421766_102369 [Zobellia uliginosa]
MGIRFQVGSKVPTCLLLALHLNIIQFLSSKGHSLESNLFVIQNPGNLLMLEAFIRPSLQP